MSEQLGLRAAADKGGAGVYRRELAERSGISATTIRAVERGTREAHGDTVAKLATRWDLRSTMCGDSRGAEGSMSVFADTSHLGLLVAMSGMAA